jgi:phytoene synthase
MTSQLEASYSYCRSVARRRAKNFYYSFLLLPRPKRDAICAMYAFMRYCDDLSDAPEAAGDPQQARAAIEHWRAGLASALDGRFGPHPLWPAFRDAVETYGIPREYFFDMIDGVTSDLEPRRIQTFSELYRYCYQVASVVGLAIVHIFGFRSPQALPLAEKCGVAFQLTNILRDVGEDAGHGRIYLPAEDLERFGVDAGNLRRTKGFLELMRFEAARAREYYRKSQPLIGMVDESSRASLWALIEIYSRLLERIEHSDFDVLSRRVRLPAWGKAWIVARGALTRPG